MARFSTGRAAKSFVRGLQELGCDIAQGYVIGKPGSTAELLARARSHIPAQGRRVVMLSD